MWWPGHEAARTFVVHENNGDSRATAKGKTCRREAAAAAKNTPRGHCTHIGPRKCIEKFTTSQCDNGSDQRRQCRRTSKPREICAVGHRSNDCINNHFANKGLFEYFNSFVTRIVCRNFQHYNPIRMRFLLQSLCFCFCWFPLSPLAAPPPPPGSCRAGFVSYVRLALAACVQRVVRSRFCYFSARRPKRHNVSVSAVNDSFFVLISFDLFGSASVVVVVVTAAAAAAVDVDAHSFH